jgi:hypothetical protein
MKHRDSTPEDPDAFAAWADNFVKVSKELQGKMGMQDSDLEFMRQFFDLQVEIMRNDDADPVEPDPIDGYTIYWDRRRRLREHFCNLLDVPIAEDGSFDGELLVRRMLDDQGGYTLEKWYEYLMNRVRETARRYSMNDEWVEAVRVRMEKVKSTAPRENQAKTGDMENLFLMFYQPE